MMDQLEILQLALQQQRLNLTYVCKLYDKKGTVEHAKRLDAETKKYEYLKHLIKIEQEKK